MEAVTQGEELLDLMVFVWSDEIALKQAGAGWMSP